jgi:tetratricopeptide (TPR) repeat protein
MRLHYLVPVVVIALFVPAVGADLAAFPRGADQEVSMEAARTDNAAAVISYVELRTRRLPRSTRKLLDRAIKLDKRGSTLEGLALVEQALESAPGFVEAHTAAAIANLKLERLGEAQRRLEDALEMDSTLLPAREIQGIPFLRERRYAEAREILSEVVKGAPGRATAHHYLAEALRALHKVELAEEQEDMAQKLYDKPFRRRREPSPLARETEGPAWTR